MAPAVLHRPGGSGWMYWTNWGDGGAGLAKGVCWGRTNPVGWGCWSWTSRVPRPRRPFGCPGNGSIYICALLWWGDGWLMGPFDHRS